MRIASKISLTSLLQRVFKAQDGPCGTTISLAMPAMGDAKLEGKYPGLKETIIFYEESDFPPCTHCGSDNVATVGTGLIGRTISLAAATTKFKLIANGPKAGEYFCSAYEKFFDK